MQCKSCKYPDSYVIETRRNDLKDYIQRRRECLRCGARFTTHEVPRTPKISLEKRVSNK
jgi:transcriptional repressor NrdR